MEQNCTLDPPERRVDVNTRLLNEHFKLIKEEVKGQATEGEIVPSDRDLAFLWGLGPRERQSWIDKIF
jgi:hypothetical protein